MVGCVCVCVFLDEGGGGGDHNGDQGQQEVVCSWFGGGVGDKRQQWGVVCSWFGGGVRKTFSSSSSLSVTRRAVMSGISSSRSSS